MEVCTNGFRNMAAVLAVGFLALAAPLGANATATYEANASFELTLVSVLDVTGAAANATGWTVDAEGFAFDLDSNATGDGVAIASNSLVPFTVMGVGDAVTQTVGVSGSATTGTANSVSLSDFQVFVENSSNDVLTFNFSYVAASGADVTGTAAGEDAVASALIDVTDINGAFDTILSANADLLFGPLSDVNNESSSFSFALLPGELNGLSGFIDAQGAAFGVPAVVPVPGTVAMLALGLAGLGYRRRQVKTA